MLSRLPGIPKLLASLSIPSFLPFFLVIGMERDGKLLRPKNSKKSLRTDGRTRRLAEERVGGAKIASVGEPCGDATHGRFRVGGGGGRE